jgi:cysteine desulfurase
MPITRPIYLDYQSTTPTDPKVVEAMLPFFTERCGNPHASAHLYGWEAEEAVEIARGQVARVINADSKEIIFTSGATESNNLAIKGLAAFYGNERRHLITVATEHKCVLESFRHLEKQGYGVTYLPVNKEGLVDLDALTQALRPDTLLVSIMAVNNETGVMQPLAEITARAKSVGAFVHTDAAQAFGKIPLNMHTMPVDMMSISGHKIYGPKGIGALYVRRRPRVRLEPLFDGGGQERGMRSGTLPTPLVVGLGKAAEMAHATMEDEQQRIGLLAEQLITGLKQLPGTVFHAEHAPKIPGCINVGFEGIQAGALLVAMKGIAVSSGSACTSHSIEPSYVLRAMGVDESLARSSIRFGIGRFTNEAEINTALDIVLKNVEKLRS